MLATILGLAFAIVFATSRRAQLPIVAAQGATNPFTPCAQPGGYGWDWANSNGRPLTLDQAAEAANLYLMAYGNPDLTMTEGMEFTEKGLSAPSNESVAH